MAASGRACRKASYFSALPLSIRRSYSEETAREIDGAIRKITEISLARACAVLADNRELLVEGARLLLDKETLTEEDLKPMFKRVRPGKVP